MMDLNLKQSGDDSRARSESTADAILQIGVAQIRNTTHIQENGEKILSFLDRFEKEHVDLVLFPECSLSGFSSKISECTLDLLNPFLECVKQWSERTGTHVVLPTTIAEHGKIYNSGFIFSGSEVSRFQKLGLTESERAFFSVSDAHLQKCYAVKDFNYSLLICMEVQQAPWTYFQDGEADFILWPGYWGWTQEDQWAEVIEAGKPNRIYENMQQWKRPLIRSNRTFQRMLWKASPPPARKASAL